MNIYTIEKVNDCQLQVKYIIQTRFREFFLVKLS